MESLRMESRVVRDGMFLLLDMSMMGNGFKVKCMVLGLLGRDMIKLRENGLREKRLHEISM